MTPCRFGAVSGPRRGCDRRSPDAWETCGQVLWLGQETGHNGLRSANVARTTAHRGGARDRPQRQSRTRQTTSPDPPFYANLLLPPSAFLLPHRSAASVAPPLLRGGAHICRPQIPLFPCLPISCTPFRAMTAGSTSGLQPDSNEDGSYLEREQASTLVASTIGLAAVRDVRSHDAVRR